MTSAERRVAQDLHELADIPVTEQDLDRAHDELEARIRALPARRTGPMLVAAAVALVLALAAAWWLRAPDAHRVTPAHQPAHASVSSGKRAATGFVAAFAAYDVPRARAWLAPGAATTGELADSADWTALNRYFEATGSKLLPEPCRMLTHTASDATFRCGFRYYALRSQELGRGPYDGSYFEIDTRDGRVTVAYMDFEYRNGFNAQMWSPFAAWMNRTHPKDAAVMYTNWPLDNQWRLTDRAISLWSQRTRDFVQHVRASAR